MLVTPNQSTLIAIDDFVQHRQAGYVGKVVGYGHQMIDGMYLPTLIVRLSEIAGTNHAGFVEDLSSAWVWVEGERGSRVA